MVTNEVLDRNHVDVRNAITVQENHTADLLSRPGVVGTAVGVDAAGQMAVKVYVESESDLVGLPADLDGLGVDVFVTGKLVARGGSMGGSMGGSNGTNPKAPQTAPIKLGTSGGWRFDLANGYCCGGTLGGLIEDGGGTQYILSNYHVLYADIVNGGNGRTASAGDPVIQPALIDVGCNANNSLDVATLVNGGGSLPGGNVDAGIAAVIPGQVSGTGEILDIGVLSSATAGAFVGQDVKKMGRTTGLGRGTVDGLNATVSITYENECAGGTAFTKTFTGQIIITNARCKFLDGGDSGSLMVEDITTNPRCVGLLFAGSTSCNKFAIAIANPIDDVLDFYGGGMQMVGN
ncbi:MAG: hypothetical protein DHS20C21_15640 [Gemmatimonadota bacterium]|nr:MAG: hypothetical protein DHS20C21_15640 [Gemmatimonadota bacterium]